MSIDFSRGSGEAVPETKPQKKYRKAVERKTDIVHSQYRFSADRAWGTVTDSVMDLRIGRGNFVESQKKLLAHWEIYKEYALQMADDIYTGTLARSRDLIMPETDHAALVGEQLMKRLAMSRAEDMQSTHTAARPHIRNLLQLTAGQRIAAAFRHIKGAAPRSPVQALVGSDNHTERLHYEQHGNTAAEIFAARFKEIIGLQSSLGLAANPNEALATSVELALGDSFGMERAAFDNSVDELIMFYQQ